MITETHLLSRIVSLVRQRLPDSWHVQSEASNTLSHLGITPPESPGLDLQVITRQRLDPYQIPALVEKYAHLDPKQILLISPYLGATTREKLSHKRINYADATGNVWISSDYPPLFIHTTGAQKDPHPETRPLASLKGAGAGRAIRALCDFLPPFGIRHLATCSGASATALSRVATLLEREDLLERAKDGGITHLNWDGVLRRWAQDYTLFKPGYYAQYLEPRGLNHLLTKLSALPLQWTLTGSLAIHQHNPVAAPRLGVVYVADVLKAAQTLGIVPAEKGANVILLEPFDPVVFQRLWQNSPDPCALPTQVAVDLLVSPGRGPEEAEALLEWMAEHEREWRQPCP